jgi:hypothetical protein
MILLTSPPTPWMHKMMPIASVIHFMVVPLS